MIGIDIGGTKIELAIFDDELNQIDVWRQKTPHTSYLGFLETIEAMVLKADTRLGKITTVGIGVPGFVDNSGKSVSANVPCIKGEQVGRDMSNRLSRMVKVDSDTKNFVASEMHGGAANGMAGVLGVILGTGVSGNYGINGQLVRGKHSRAGEFGHIAFSSALIEKYGFPVLYCGCGLSGCVEPYLSGAGLLRMSEHFGGTFSSALEVAEAIDAGNESAKAAYAAYVDCTGSFLAHLVMIFDPDMIVLGGGVSNIRSLYADLPQQIVAHTIEGFVAPAVVPAAFGDSSGVRGAALLGNGRL